MVNRKSLASILIFVGSTLCFLLPFVTVSCGGVTAFTLTGMQLATGTALNQPQAFGPPQTQKVDADPFAAIAGLCAIGGIALSLIGRRLAGATAVSGGAGAVSLLVMRTRLDVQLQKQTHGMASVTYETGFTLAVLLLIAGAAWSFFLVLQNKHRSDAAPITPDTAENSDNRTPIQSQYPPLVAEGQGNPPSRSASNENSQDAPGQQVPNARLCSRCGQEIGTTARFCETCGNPAEVPAGDT